MYLHELKIWNFRKYGTSDNEDIKTDNPGLVINFNKKLNLLVGENDSGKTAIIDAIKQVLLTKSQEYIRLDEKDFYKGADERTAKLKIECVFQGFDKDGKEAANFLEWIGFNDDNEYELKLWLYAERKDNRIITDVKAGADNEGTQLDGNARDLLRITYLKPLRDALAELTPGYRSRLAQILKSHELFQKKKNEDKKHPLEYIIKTANDKIENYFEKDKIKITIGDKEEEFNTANEIKIEIDKYLELFFPVDNANKSFIRIAGSELSDILNKLSLNIDENKSGLGSLNLLFIAAELLLLETETKNGLQLALIEEIEAHLHAQAQLRLIEYLQKQKGQFILTTHSITLASKINLENLIICKGDKVFPMGNKHTQLEAGDYKFLQRFLDVTKANLFFARGVIIVEGDAENLLIPTIAEIIGMPLHKYGVSIVNVGSTAFKRYAKIFLRLGKDNVKYKDEWLDIPVAIISDIDIKPKEYYEDKKEKMPENIDNDITVKTNELKQNWNKQNIEIFIATKRTLEYDIALSVLQKEIFQSILIAGKIKNSKDEKYYENIFNEDGSFIIPAEIEKKQKELFTNWAKLILQEDENSKIAYEIYKYIKEKQISKAITAQCFAEILLKDKINVKKIFIKDNYLKYIVDAIKHVTLNADK